MQDETLQKVLGDRSPCTLCRVHRQGPAVMVTNALPEWASEPPVSLNCHGPCMSALNTHTPMGPAISYLGVFLQIHWPRKSKIWYQCTRAWVKKVGKHLTCLSTRNSVRKKMTTNDLLDVETWGKCFKPAYYKNTWAFECILANGRLSRKKKLLVCLGNSTKQMTYKRKKNRISSSSL